MRDKKKAVFNILFLLLVFGLTVYGVFRGEDLESMMHSIRQAQWQWLVPGVALVLFFIWSESIIIWYMMKSYGTRLKKRSCFLFSSVGFFFSCITPSASGGQPMQIYYMKKEKILIFGQGFLHRYLEGILPVYYLGLGLNVFCVVFMTVLVFHPVLTKEILKKGVHLLEKLRLMKHKEERLEKLDASMDTYRGTAVYLKEHMGVIVVGFGITFVQRMALFAATWFVYRAFGLSGTSFFDILFLQAVIAVAVDMLPLPGGMGISETLFLNIFRPVFGSLLLPGMVLSRGLGYYAELLNSAAFTVVAQLTIGNEKVREQKKCIKERVEG